MCTSIHKYRGYTDLRYKSTYRPMGYTHKHLFKDSIHIHLYVDTKGHT